MFNLSGCTCQKTAKRLTDIEAKGRELLKKRFASKVYTFLLTGGKNKCSERIDQFNEKNIIQYLFNNRNKHVCILVNVLGEA